MTNPTPTPSTPTPEEMKANLEAILRNAAKAKAPQTPAPASKSK